MIALDTNVLLRYLIQDEPKQGPAAARFVEQHLSAQQPGFVSLVVVFEMIWVMRSGYRLGAEDIATALARLLDAKQIRVERHAILENALQGGIQQLADRVIHEIGRSAGCTETATFDRRFARIEGVRLLTG